MTWKYLFFFCSFINCRPLHADFSLLDLPTVPHHTNAGIIICIFMLEGTRAQRGSVTFLDLLRWLNTVLKSRAYLLVSVCLGKTDRVKSDTMTTLGAIKSLVHITGRYYTPVLLRPPFVYRIGRGAILWSFCSPKTGFPSWCMLGQ